MRLSRLDRSRTRTGYPEGAALRHSVERAVEAESLGYHRFWGAEHHAVPGIASGSPAVLLSAAGAHTSRIRLGSGGVMLPHHQPLVVAEQFLMLEGLYPGRIDLGLGRTLGFTEPVRRALRQNTDDVDQFASEVAELRAYLRHEAAVTARPAAETVPRLFQLATGQGLVTAAGLGLPVVVGGPALHSPDLEEKLTAYRRNFRPTPEAPEPQVVISLDVFLTDTEEEARELALPEAWAIARSRETGEFAPLETAEDIHAQRWSPRTRSRVEKTLERTIAGPAGVVGPVLERLTERTGAQELLVSTSTYDREALAAMDARLAELVL